MRSQQGSRRSYLIDAMVALAGVLVGVPLVGCGSSQQAPPPAGPPNSVLVPAAASATPPGSDDTSMVSPGVDEPEPVPSAVPLEPDEPEPATVGPIRMKYGGPSAF